MLLVFGGVAILVGAFTIFNTLSITVAQRTREFAMLRMVGAARRQVLGSVMLEALALGLGASIIGIGAGFGLAAGLNAIFGAMDLDLPASGTVFEARTAIVALLVGTLVTLAAGSCRRGARRRSPPWRRCATPIRRRAGCAGRPASCGRRRRCSAGRRQVRRMIRHESIITALLGAATGIAAGLGVAAILATVFADERGSRSRSPRARS